MPEQQFAKLPIESFYGQPSIMLPDHLVGGEGRYFIHGTINLHHFEAIAEPWRDKKHVLIFPAYLARQLWINEGVAADLVFNLSADIPHPTFPAPMQRLLKENPDYAQAFNSLTPSDQTQYLAWINAADTPAELDKRSEETVKYIRSLLNLGKVFNLISG